MEAQIIPTIAQRCRATGISFCTEISLSELYSREPGLRKQAKGALWIPGETVVDPWLTAISLAHDAKKKGAKVTLNFTTVNLHLALIIKSLFLLFHHIFRSKQTPLCKTYLKQNVKGSGYKL